MILLAMSTDVKSRILVVDDEQSISDLISTSLRFVGFEVRTAASGQEALRVAEEFKPNAMVLDVMLPDLNGFEVCEKIRNEGQDIGVLFLTAKDAIEDKVEDDRLEANPFESVAQRELLDIARQVIAELSPKEAAIIRLRFGLVDDGYNSEKYPITQEEINQVMNGKSLT